MEVVNMKIPKAFLSYSHDSQEHKKWVLGLATRLRNNGIDAILDQFELQAGADLPHFMETQLASSDKILMICTKKYVVKANDGHGGVGYEKMIITSNLLKNIDQTKIIPLIKQDGTSHVPTFLGSKLYINFSNPDDFEFCYDELVRTIHNAPLFEKPAIGNNPFKPVVKDELDESIQLQNKLLEKIIEHQGTEDVALSGLIVDELNISAGIYKVMLLKLEDRGLANRNIGYEYVSATKKGLMYAYEKGLIK